MEQDRASGGGVVEGGPRQKASDGRLRQLDSIRGIAALFVLFNHYVQVVPERLRPPASLDQILTVATWTSAVTWLRFTPLRLLVDGEAAVDLFFVLSGFVLALPMTQRSQPALWAFLAKRFCRVYLPFAGVILIVAAAYQLIPTAPSGAVSHWLNGLLVRRGGYSLTAHLLMRGRQTDMRLDPVMWSLVHELRVSIVLPAIFLAIRWIGAAETVAASVLISLTASVGMADSVSGDWQATAHFLWMFAAGSHAPAAALHPPNDPEPLGPDIDAADRPVRPGMGGFPDRKRGGFTYLSVPQPRLDHRGALCASFALAGARFLQLVPCPPASFDLRRHLWFDGLGVGADFCVDPRPGGTDVPIAGAAITPDRRQDRPLDWAGPTTSRLMVSAAARHDLCALIRRTKVRGASRRLSDCLRTGTWIASIGG
jgi:hypothetical protein